MYSEFCRQVDYYLTRLGFDDIVLYSPFAFLLPKLLTDKTLEAQFFDLFAGIILDHVYYSLHEKIYPPILNSSSLDEP